MRETPCFLLLSILALHRLAYGPYLLWVVRCTYMRVWHCCLRLLGSKLDVSVNQLVCVGTEKELDIKRKQGGATTLPLISRKKRHSHLELCIANTFLTREGRKSLFVREVEEV
ncbi:hypothetical protein F5H01DRAFT_341040 [Linnemannia elongata]|nr:hypothetical protein F5H01DRAFT_341040 [Linnemannia elongata]